MAGARIREYEEILGYHFEQATHHRQQLGLDDERTREQLEEAAAADKSIEAEEGVHFERAWLDPEAGKVFCLSTGPSKEAVLRIHERAGHSSAERCPEPCRRGISGHLGPASRRPANRLTSCDVL